jgi:amiloride-sensitive sodium channel
MLSQVSDDESKSMSCDCLPSCTSIIYNSEVSRRNLNLKTSTTRSINRIFFKDNNFISMERNELFGDTDFWANCGGLLGLFTGFSVMSFFEIIYFLSMRWMCNMFAAKSQPTSADAE